MTAPRVLQQSSRQTYPLPPSPVLLKTQTVYGVYPDSPPKDSIWDKILRGAKKALPYIAEAAAGFQVPARSYTSSNIPYNEPIYQSQSSNRSHSVQRLADRASVNIPSRSLRPNLLDRIQPQSQLPPAMKMNQLEADSRRILNNLATAQGLPSYEQFHQDHGLVYSSQPNNRGSGITEYFRMQAAQPSRGYIQEDSQQIAENLAHGQKPFTPAEQLQLQQAELFAQQEEEARQAALWRQRQQQWARRAAEQLRQQTQSQADSRPPLKAQVTKSRQKRLLELAFRDPLNPEQSILEQANGPERLPESRLKQAELNLDTLQAQGAITPSEYQELAVTAKAATAQNWLRHDGKDNGNGTVTYRGVTLDKKIASQVAYADAKRYWDKEVHLTTQELAKAAIELSKGVYDFFIGDDIKTLQDRQASILAKAIAGGSLALTFGGGFIEKAGLKAIEKVGGKFLIQVSGKSEKTLAILVKNGLNPEQIRNYKRLVSDKPLIKNFNIYHLPDGGKVFEGIMPAENKISHTVWQKFVDAEGKTIIYGHRTEEKSGKLIHWHEQFPQKKLEIDLRGTNGQLYIEHLKQILNTVQKGP